jgi:predicted PurR-regulated permease PerM
MEKRSIEISWVSLWRIFIFLIFAATLYLGSQILLALFAAIVISSGLDFMVDFLEKRKIPRTLAVILIFLGFMLAIAAVIYLVIPFVVADLNTVLVSLNKSKLGAWFGPAFNLKATQSVGALIDKLTSQIWGGGTSPIDTLSALLGSVGLAIAIIIISFYLAVSRDGVERFLRAVMPLEYEAPALSIYERSRKKIGSWFRTQILASFIMGVLVWASLAILGLKHAFIIAMFAAVFELVPFVGPILAGAIAFIFALTSSPVIALYTLIVFLILHQFESHVLVPLLTRRAVGLHPVIVIVALLIGIETSGLLGAIIAVPMAAVLQEVIEHRSWGRVPRPEIHA